MCVCVCVCVCVCYSLFPRRPCCRRGPIVSYVILVLTHPSSSSSSSCGGGFFVLMIYAQQSRDMNGAQTALRGREWSPPLAPYVALVEGRVKERQLVIISKAFMALPLARMASMLGCSVEDAEKGARVASHICKCVSWVSRKALRFFLTVG